MTVTVHDDYRQIEFMRTLHDGDQLIEAVFPAKLGYCCESFQNMKAATDAEYAWQHHGFDFELWCFNHKGHARFGPLDLTDAEKKSLMEKP